MSYAIYLRKSQADLEAEAGGAGETLSRHRSALLDLSKRLNLDIGAIYEEIVSGETIAARPQMQKLLSEVGQGLWKGVLVMEVERLARGDSIDQGIVAQAFKYSGTKIITPAKTYDPSNEFDEEYLEFGLFMSRREYNSIRRRMVSGRIASVKEGKYMGKVDPFGYRRVKLANEKGWSLEVVPEQAEILQKIFAWYLEPGGSITAVARRLKAMGCKTRVEEDWSRASVIQTLRNPLYCGYVTWGHKPVRKTIESGQVKKKRYLTDDYIKVRGRHKALVSESDWQAVQHKLDTTPGYKVRSDRTMRNPFQGLLYCGDCGHAMQLTTSTRGGKPNYGIFCPWPHCSNVSARLPALEGVVLDALQEWLRAYKVEIAAETADSSRLEDMKTALAASQAEIKRVTSQIERAYELVEQGVYTAEHFVEGKKKLPARRDKLTEEAEQYRQQMDVFQQNQHLREEFIPWTEEAIRAYPSAQDAEQKNQMLRQILQKIMYRKHPIAEGKGRQYALSLDFYPAIPDAAVFAYKTQ